jgi:predicted TIM-barrel fold metal-dependent hydrolase
MLAIDIHGHFGPYDRGAGSLFDRLLSADIEVVRRRARDAGVGLTVVSATRALMPYGGDVARGNEEAREAAERHADIRFWAVLDPRLSESYGQVEALLAHPRCAGIKIHPAAHEYEIREHGEAVFAFAERHRALVLTHSGDPGSFPEHFIPFANRHPRVSLILAHLGHSADGTVARQVAALKRAERGDVYVDTSSARSMLSGLIEWAVAEVSAQRLLFGTDTPLYFVAAQKARVEHAEIPEDAKRAILRDNAARLLGEAVADATTE